MKAQLTPDGGGDDVVVVDGAGDAVDDGEGVVAVVGGVDDPSLARADIRSDEEAGGLDSCRIPEAVVEGDPRIDDGGWKGAAVVVACDAVVVVRYHSSSPVEGSEVSHLDQG